MSEVRSVMKTHYIAYYLPQFHPIPENDAWWEPGFTEWTNVTKAKPLFRGHQQPKYPADLGYYDLRVPETRRLQASIAKQYGIDAFCYWHYWFGDGKRLLERPFREVLESGQPDFPFCLAWANASWCGFEYGLSNQRNVLIEQKYLGDSDYRAHFEAVLPAFQDSRYFKIENKPVFVVFQPFGIPDPRNFVAFWKDLAKANGLPGLFFVAQTERVDSIDELRSFGFDAVNLTRLYRAYRMATPRIWRSITRRLGLIQKVRYQDVIRYLTGPEDARDDCFPTAYPNWDHTPRSGRRGLVLQDSSPELFYQHLKQIHDVIGKKDPQRQIVFIKSWNEWAEGNYLEPDSVFKYGYLEAVRRSLADLD